MSINDDISNTYNRNHKYSTKVLFEKKINNKEKHLLNDL